jgi:hypothetical protein
MGADVKPKKQGLAAALAGLAAGRTGAAAPTPAGWRILIQTSLRSSPAASEEEADGTPLLAQLESNQNLNLNLNLKPVQVQRSDRVVLYLSSPYSEWYSASYAVSRRLTCLHILDSWSVY